MSEPPAAPRRAPGAAWRLALAAALLFAASAVSGSASTACPAAFLL